MNDPSGGVMSARANPALNAAARAFGARAISSSTILPTSALGVLTVST